MIICAVISQGYSVAALSKPAANKAAWRSRLSAAHRGPRPGKARVQKAPNVPNSNKMRWK